MSFAVTATLVIVVMLSFVGWRLYRTGRPVPAAIKPGQTLPDFQATTEDGTAVHSTDLRGSPAVILFVRGNWCPFCSSQVSNLTDYYKAIVDLGARLIFVTPKPLQTTRRVAEFFEVDFEFWLDADLAITRQLGLLMPAAVPRDHRNEYGDDTVWPTALVVDSDGIIRYATLSKFIADRPNPKTLLREARSVAGR